MQLLIRSYRSTVMIGLLLILGVQSTPIYAAELPAQEDTHLLNDSNLKEIDALFGKIHEICNEMAFLLKSTQVNATKEERALYMQALVETRGFVQMIQRAIVVQPTTATFTHIFELLSDVVNHLQQAINKNFAGFTAYEPKEMRGQPAEELDNQAIEALVKEKIELVGKLHKESEDAGLSSVNRFYRAVVNRFIIQPCAKWKLHWWAGAAALTTVSAAYVWYHLCHDKVWGRELSHPKIAGATIIPHMYEPTDPWYWRAYAKGYEFWNSSVFSILGTPLEDPKDEYHNNKIRVALNLYDAYLKDPKLPQDILNATPEAVADIINKIDPEHAEILAQHLVKTTIDSARTSVVDLVDQITKNTNDYQIVAKIDRLGYKVATGSTIIGTTLSSACQKFGIFNLLSKCKEKIEYGALKLHAKCMGGAFYEQFKSESYSFEIEPRCTFDDLIGLEHAKEDLLDVIKFVENPEKYLRSGLKPPTNLLLYGSSRTGKTMLIEALAGELRKKKTREEFPFYRFSSHHIAQNIFELLMALVRENAPCIIFIDEFDMLDLNREGNKKQLGEFLNTLSGCMNSSPDKPIIFIAACNTPNKLDDALRQRFNKEIPFEKPSFENRMAYFNDQLMKKGLAFHPMEIQVLCSLTDGCTLDKISKIIELTCFRKSSTGIPVGMQDIIETINTDVLKIMQHNFKDLSKAEKKILAFHMTGHMFATLWMNNMHEQLSQATIRPVKNAITKEYNMHDPTVHYGDVFTCNPSDTLGFEDQEYYKAKCMQKLAGLITEEVLLGKQHITKYSCSCKDKADALSWARKYCLNGLDEKEVQESKHLKAQLADDARAFMQACEQELREKIANNAELIAFVAEQLLQIESLDVSSLQILIKAHPKVQAGMSLHAAFQEAMMEMQQEFEQEMAKITQDADATDVAELFNH